MAGTGGMIHGTLRLEYFDGTTIRYRELEFDTMEKLQSADISYALHNFRLELTERGMGAFHYRTRTEPNV